MPDCVLALDLPIRTGPADRIGVSASTVRTRRLAGMIGTGCHDAMGAPHAVQGLAHSKDDFRFRTGRLRSIRILRSTAIGS